MSETIEVVTFVELRPFAESWKDLGLSDDDLMALQVLIMLGPRRHPPVSGTGGLRKLRFAPSGWKRGKRGAIRIGYVYLEEYTTVLLVVAYAKKEKDDLTPGERKVIKRLIEQVKREFETGLIH